MPIRVIKQYSCADNFVFLFDVFTRIIHFCCVQNVLQVFVTSAANVFLLQVSAEYPLLLDEQVEHCKHVLNTYRYMVMNTRMERATW